MKRTRTVRVATLYSVIITLAILAVAGPVLACEEVRSPGYWKNHPDAWPVDSLTIGGVEYTVEEAIEIMQTPGKGDKSYTLFNALAAALLNETSGADTCAIVADAIDDAQDWFVMYPLGSDIRGSSDAWKDGEPLYCVLDAYNNGWLCVPAVD